MQSVEIFSEVLLVNWVRNHMLFSDFSVKNPVVQITYHHFFKFSVQTHFIRTVFGSSQVLKESLSLFILFGLE